MRYLSLLIACFPVSLWAGDIPLSSSVSKVVIFPQGATITREVRFTAPAGQHQLVLTDLPPNVPLARVRVGIQGADMGSVTSRNDYLPPTDPEKQAREQEIEDEIDRIEADILTLESEMDLRRTEVQAAEAQVRFLEGLSSDDSFAELGVAALRDLAGMVGEETLKALRQRHAAELRVAEVERRKEDAQEALARAKEALAALRPGINEDRAMVAVAISSDTETSGTAQITYTIDEAGWMPVYDVRLTRETGVLRIERGAFISQYSGENWTDVGVTLSTSRPSEQSAPSEIWPWLRRIHDPADKMSAPLARAGVEADSLEGVLLAEPVMEEAPQGATMIAPPSFDGLSVSYEYPGKLSIANAADRVRIALGTLESAAELSAMAVPLSDPTAYLMAAFSNETDEVILPTWEAMFYLDDRFVGQRSLGMIPAGGKVDLSFGPIDGLQLSRVVLDRSEGDRGLISRSNEQTEEARIEVENLTGQTWPVRLLDRVPYSEQEDLQISWEATPSPTEENVDDRRGILAWDFDLPVGETKTIRMTHRIAWPDGKQLR